MTTGQIVASVLGFLGLLCTVLGVIWRAGTTAGRVAGKLDDIVKALDAIREDVSNLAVKTSAELQHLATLTADLRLRVTLWEQRMDRVEERCADARCHRPDA